MTTYAWPSGVVPQVLRWELLANCQVMESPLSRASQTLELPGARWRFMAQLAPGHEADVVALQAWLVKLRGRANRFTAHPFDRPTPLGTLAGTPLVKGAAQTGTSLLIDGCTVGTTLLAGDWFAVGGELKLATADVTANGSGEITVSFEPPLRASPADNAAVTISYPTATFMLAGDDQGWDVAPGLMYGGISIDAVEVF